MATQDERELHPEAIYLIRTAGEYDLLFLDGFLYEYMEDSIEDCWWICIHHSDPEDGCLARVRTKPEDDEFMGQSGSRRDYAMGGGSLQVNQIQERHNHGRLDPLDIAGIVKTKNELLMEVNKLKISEGDVIYTTTDELNKPMDLEMHKLYVTLKDQVPFSLCVNGCIYVRSERNALTVNDLALYDWQCKEEDCPAKFRTKHNMQGEIARFPLFIDRRHMHVIHESSPVPLEDEKDLVRRSLRSHSLGPSSIETVIKDELEEEEDAISLIPATQLTGTDRTIRLRHCKNPLVGLDRKDVFYFLPSQRGKKILCVNNEVYNYDCRSPRHGRSYWTCINRRRPPYNCPARLTLEVGDEGPYVVRITGSHLHPNNASLIKKKIEKLRWKKGDFEKNLLFNDEDAKLLVQDFRSFKDKPKKKQKKADKKKMRLKNKYNFKMIEARTNEKIAKRVKRLQMKARGQPVSSSESSESDSSMDSKFDILSDSDNDLDTNDNFHQNDDDDFNLTEFIEFPMAEDKKTLKKNLGTTTPNRGFTFNSTSDRKCIKQETDPFRHVSGSKGGEGRSRRYALQDDSPKDIVRTLIASDSDDNPIAPMFRPVVKSNAATGSNCDNDDDDDDDSECDVYDGKRELRVGFMTPIRSFKGGESIFADGYIFNMKTFSKTRVYWNCIKTKHPEFNCHSRIATSSAEEGYKLLRAVYQHSHPVDESDIKKRLASELKVTWKDEPERLTVESVRLEVERRYEELMSAVESHKVDVEEIENAMDSMEAQKAITGDLKRNGLCFSRDGVRIHSIRMLRSAKGGDLLCVNGFIYHMKKNIGNNTYWVCIKSKDKKVVCNARVITTVRAERVRVLKLSTSHNHKVSGYDIKRRLLNEIKQDSNIEKTLELEQEVEKQVQKLLRNIDETTIEAFSPIKHEKDIEEDAADDDEVPVDALEFMEAE